MGAKLGGLLSHLTWWLGLLDPVRLEVDVAVARAVLSLRVRQLLW